MIRERAEEAALALLGGHAGGTPPIDVEGIARELGIDVVYQDIEDAVSGLLVRKGPRVVIGVNSRHHPNRQRFTIAHELGHHQMHADSPTVFVDGAMVHFREDELTDPCDLREIAANAFAAALLMPESALRAVLKGRRVDALDETVVRSLAKRFQVSQQALTIRLIHLGLLVGMPAF